jgi:hypothetical protein
MAAALPGTSGAPAPASPAVDRGRRRPTRGRRTTPAGLLARSAGHPRGRGPAFWWRPLGGEDVAAWPATSSPAAWPPGGRARPRPRPRLARADAALAVAGDAGADLRAASDRARYRAFLRCRVGQARVAVGERGAALAPLRDLGLVVVDDEANPAYKERRAPRHHARDVALARARMAGATAVLLGDLPSAPVAAAARRPRAAVDGGPRHRARAHRGSTVVDRSRSPSGRPAGPVLRPHARGAHRRGARGRCGVVVAARGGAGQRAGLPALPGPARLPGLRGLGAPRRGEEPDAVGVPGLRVGRSAVRLHVLRRHAQRPARRRRGAPRAGARAQPSRGRGRAHGGLRRARPDARPALGVMTRGSVVSRPAVARRTRPRWSCSPTPTRSSAGRRGRRRGRPAPVVRRRPGGALSGRGRTGGTGHGASCCRPASPNPAGPGARALGPARLLGARGASAAPSCATRRPRR